MKINSRSAFAPRFGNKKSEIYSKINLEILNDPNFHEVKWIYLRLEHENPCFS
jgi:hypothetical protein